MNETNRHVYHENTTLIDSLRVHKQHLDELKKLEEHLSRQIASSSNEKELNEILIKEKLEQIQKQNHQIKEVSYRE